MKKALVLFLGLLLVGSVPAFAGDDGSTSSSIPKIITFTREDIKIGKMNEHDDLVRAVRRAANDQRANLYWVAGRSIAGNTSDFVNISFYNSYADIDRSNEAFNSVLRASYNDPNFAREAVDTHVKGRQIIAEYRGDLSFGQQRFDVANATRWKVTIVQLKPGTMMDYAETRKAAIDLYRKGNIEVHSIAYEATAGAPGPTLIFLTAMRSLADLDVDRKAQMDAVFTPTIRRQINSVVRDSVVSSESTIIAVRPEISRPPDTIVAANPNYWTVKDEPVVARGKRGRTAAGTVQPASSKERDNPKP